jgi:hypothetical protein
MSIASISKYLQAEPSESFEKGSSVSRRVDHSRVREESIWIFDSSGETLEDCLAQLMQFLETKRSTTLPHFFDWKLDIFCGLRSPSSQPSLAISARMLSRLAAFPIDLLVDFIPT